MICGLQAATHRVLCRYRANAGLCKINKCVQHLPEAHSLNAIQVSKGWNVVANVVVDHQKMKILGYEHWNGLNFGSNKAFQWSPLCGPKCWSRRTALVRWLSLACFFREHDITHRRGRTARKTVLLERRPAAWPQRCPPASPKTVFVFFLKTNHDFVISVLISSFDRPNFACKPWLIFKLNKPFMNSQLSTVPSTMTTWSGHKARLFDSLASLMKALCAIFAIRFVRCTWCILHTLPKRLSRLLSSWELAERGPLNTFLLFLS